MRNKINLNEVEWEVFEHGFFSGYRKKLASKSGGKQLGASLYKLLPGKAAFPFHFHYANEEAILVLQGEGTFRYSKDEIAIKVNDYISLPKGADHAHQIINTSNNELIYLCFSTMIEPDVMEYPDSNKVGMMTGTAPGGEKTETSRKLIFKKEHQTDYYDGEKTS